MLCTRFCLIKKIGEKVKKKGALLEKETDPKIRMKLINDEFALLEALVHKHGHDRNFRNYVSTSMIELIIKTKLEES